MTRLALHGMILLALLFHVAAAQAQSVTRSTFVVLERVQKLMEEERYSEAKTELEELVSKTRKNPYDFAIANRYMAHTSVMLDDTPRARSALEAALASPDLPVEIRSDLNLFYGTLLLGEEEYALARSAMEEWYATATKRKPGQLFSFAYAHYMSGSLAEAESLIATAITDAKQPLENWYQLQYRILFDQKKHRAAEAVLLGMVSRSPAKKTLWRMLASHYLRLEKSNDALAVIMVAYKSDIVGDDKELEEIVSLYNYIDAPEKGARLLQTWIDEQKLPEDAETLKKLGNLWLMARERKNAKATLRQAATLAPDGSTYELLGGIHFEDEEWAEAHAAYNQAIRAGGLEEPLRVALLAGISAFRAGLTEDARRSLTAAAESSDLRPQAESLLKQLNES